jgi:HTH-type transcriptional regulator/antitoxin HigA
MAGQALLFSLLKIAYSPIIKTMDINLDNYRTPGQLISALLERKEWTNRVLAIVLGADETSINKLISDRRPVKADMALTLGEVFDVPPEYFLDLQKNYDLAQARIINRPDPERANRAAIFGDLPITSMIKRGWIDAKSIRDKKNVESELINFFGVNDISEIEILPHAAKKTEVFTEATSTQLVWLYRVKTIASEMMVARYTPQLAAAAVKKLQALLGSVEEVRKVPRILAESGIRFVIAETLPSAKIDGACFWLNDSSPVIGMSLRFDRIDNFWFVLRHELEHVIQGHGKITVMLDVDLEGSRAGSGDSVAEEERIANAAAADFCVPRKKLEGFIARKSPFFSERDIIGFSRTMGIHPGLVAGQIQRHTGRYNIFRDHLVKVRSKITPSAVVDGWGDVYPVDI